MPADTLRTIVTAAITLVVLAATAVAVLTHRDAGPLTDWGGIVVGYWFGARAAETVHQAARGGGGVPSVL